MSEDLLRRLFDTKHSLPVITPQTIQLLQSIVGFQQPDNEYRSPALQASRFADLQQPSRGNLFITDSAKTATQRMLPDEGESGFSLSDLSSDQRQIILEQARQGAFDFDDFLTTHNPQSLYADMEEDDEAEQAFRQMMGQPKPVLQFVRKNRNAKIPESINEDRNGVRAQAAKQSSGSYPTRKSQPQMPQPTTETGDSPPPADLLEHLAPREVAKIQASKEKVSLTKDDEATLYRQWYRARRQGRISDTLQLGKVYEQLFPTGPHWKIIYDENKRLTPQDARTTKARGGTIVVPTDFIAQAKKQGASDDEILSQVRGYLSEHLGLKPQQIAALTNKYSKHPLGQLLNTKTGNPLTVDDILGSSKNGLFPFYFSPEFLAALEKATASNESKEGFGAFAANAGRTLASLPAVIPRYAAMITSALGSDEKEGLSGNLLKFGDALQNSLQPEYLREQAEESADTWSGMAGNAVASVVNSLAGGAALNTSKTFSNIKNLLPDKGILSRFSPAGTAFGMLQGGGQAFDEAVKAGATREQALANGLLNALINLSEGIGAEGLIDKIALKSFAAQKAKEALLGRVENFGQEFFQGVASDAVKQLTYDPKSKTFSANNLIKNLKSATIGTLLGITTNATDSRLQGAARRNAAKSLSNTGLIDSSFQSNKNIATNDSGSIILKTPVVTAPLLEIPPTVETAKNSAVSKESTNATPGTPESVRQKVVAEPEVALPKAVLEPESASPRTVAESEIKSPKTVTEPEITLPVETALQAKPIESVPAKTAGETLSFKILNLIRSPLSGYVGNMYTVT